MPSAPTRVQTSEVASVSFAIASPETILRWAPREVKNGDTIRHKTHQPFEDGLYCPKIREFTPRHYTGGTSGWQSAKALRTKRPAKKKPAWRVVPREYQ